MIVVKWFLNEKGAVSIFFIVIIGAIFFFNALLIDLARVKIAENQSENTLKSAFRSTLSAFDHELLTYGLFGLGINQLQGGQETEKTLNDNYSLNLENQDFSLIQLKLLPNKFSYKHIYSLANQSVFEHQILEEMKYRAPVEFTRGIVMKFSEVSPAIKQAEQFTQNADKLESMIKTRDNSLSEAWKQVAAINEQIEVYHGNYNKLIAENNEGMDKKEIKLLIKDSGNENSKLNILKEKMEGNLDKAKKLDEEISSEINRLASMQSNGPSESSNANDVFHHVPILGNAYFVNYSIEAAEVVSYYGGFINRLIQQADSMDSLEQLIQLNNLYMQKSSRFYNSRKAEELKRQSERNDVESQKTNKINQTQATLNKVTSEEEATSKSNQYACSENSSQYYDELTGDHGLYNKYLQMNGIENTPDQTQQISYIEAEDSGKRSLSMLNHLTDILDKLRNEIYINEYALTYFNYRTYSIDLAGSKAAVSLSKPEKHLLVNQEVEYLLYGFGSCLGNTTAAYAELFSIRLALRTVEALTDPQKVALGSPMLVFLEALTQGVAEAYADMDHLLKGEDIPLMGKLKFVKMNYKDYLKLFLFLHGSDSKLMARMQALIELNTGKDLLDKATYVEATASTSLKLWFIPSVFKALGVLGFLDGSIDRNHYEINKQAVMSY